MKIKRLIALISATALLISGCSSITDKKDLTYTDTLFDTVISIQILDPVDKSVIKGCEKLCKEYDAKFSKSNEDSEISQINNAKGKFVEVSDDTITLLEKGIYYGNMSKGLFDITIGCVSKLWDFQAEEPSIPSTKKVNAAKRHINYRNIMIVDNKVKLTDPKASLDVGAIAKGYIADRIKDYLVSKNVKHAIINLGGNVLVLGTKTDGSKYNIGIQRPFDETGEPITSVKVAGKSVVTTGTYQRYFKKNGKLYHHILSPNTGVPCRNNLSSVTIITDSSLTADAMSTTCFLMGYEEGMKLVNLLDNVDAIFITDDNEIHYSDNFLKN